MRLADLKPRMVSLLGAVEQREKYAGKRIYRKSVEVTCKVCGAIFKKKPSKVDLGDVKYCSRKCKDESQRKGQ